MSTIQLEAEIRKDVGKGSSRRLRRLHNKVPAIVYGGDKESKLIHLYHNKVSKALELESIYSSVFDIIIEGKVEKVILKDLQRHPYKPVVLHMDFQRVSAKDMLVKMIPMHFINEEGSKGVKAGGLVTHTMTQVEVKCQVKDLPEFINVDLADMDVNDVLHLSDLKLPKGVKLAIDPTLGDHDHPVVSIHMPRVVVEEELVASEEVEVITAAKSGAEDKHEGDASEETEA
jgi:large subunit ribosomal protein L25